jgi:hypothetical protein
VKLEVDANTAKVSVRAALFLHKMTIHTKQKRIHLAMLKTPRPPMIISFLELDMATRRSALQSCNASL